MIFAMHICRSRLFSHISLAIILIQESLANDTEDASTGILLSLVGSTTCLLHLEHFQLLLGLLGRVGNGRVDQWSESGR